MQDHRKVAKVSQKNDAHCDDSDLLIIYRFMLSVVSVTTPWERTTYLPQDSSVIMSCTSEKFRSLVWHITLPGHDQPHQFFDELVIAILNNHSFYKMPEIEHDMSKTIQLLINGTEGNNGTTIACVDVAEASTINKTTIIIDGEYRGLWSS